ncbi:MAG: oxidoreductase [Jatrophihabitans sp.]|uniref:oxidoreductase n=1 Tax=Jatrophihabitans sp. TaxID=1932789 RepID=UPI0039139886
MGLLRRGRNRPGTLRAATSGDVDHLREFIRSRQGVEAYLEPRTAVTDTTVVLVAADGEWTRRRVSDTHAAESLAKKHAIPLYDAVKVGYPQRMRDWTARRKESGGRSFGGSDGVPS